MLLIFPFIIIASFLGKMRGGNFIYRLCYFWADVWMFLIGLSHRNIYEQPHDDSRQYIFVCNHISYLDAPVMVKAFRQKIRVLGKAELAKVPLFGFIYRHAVVMVDRKDVAHRMQSVKTLRSILNRKISVFIFPEGTFNMTSQPLKEFYNGAFRIAIETQTPIKPILFLDTYDRLNYNSVFSFTPGKSRAVFLAETNTSGMSIADLPFLKNKIYKQMEETLIKYNASWIKFSSQSSL